MSRIKIPWIKNIACLLSEVREEACKCLRKEHPKQRSASTKAQKQECAWYVSGRPGCLEQSELGSESKG